MADWSFEAEVKAMESALWTCLDRKLYPNYIFSDCTNLVDLMYKDDPLVMWRYK